MVDDLPEQKPWKDMKRAKEEEFFRKKNEAAMAELLQKMKKKSISDQATEQTPPVPDKK